MAKKPAIIAQLDGYGGPEQASFHEITMPEPAQGEVLLQVVASGVSNMDLFIRDGRFQDAVPLTFPARQGCSVAGIVRKVGHGVTGLSKGDEVLGFDPGHGAYATWLALPASAVVKKPARLAWEPAGALYLVGLTAYTLVQSLRLGDGDTVLVSAAAGGVGHLECQLARLAGARVIGIAGRENHDYLRSIGAKPVAYGPDLKRDIEEAAGGPITAMLDNYGGYELLADELQVPSSRRALTAQRRDTEIALYTAADGPSRLTELLDVAELISEWGVRMLISGFYPFSALDRALEDLAGRHSRGVVVVGMDTSAPAAEYLRGTKRAHDERLSAAR